MKKRNAVLLSTPYLIWMVLFTLIPLGVVGYYALTDPGTGEFSLANVRQLGTYLPVLWSSRKERDQHDASVGRFFLVLLTLR